MGRQLLSIIGISTSSLQSNTFALILGVEGTNKRIPIIIGAYEAQAIAIALEEMTPTRPLTHDLLKNVMSSFSIQATEVYINKFSEGVFFSLISFSGGKRNLEIDSRTSDAVAMAIRYNCPIYADDTVIEATAMEEENNPENISEENEEESRAMTLEELEEYLQILIEQENYEEASKVRDEIKRLKDQG